MTLRELIERLEKFDLDRKVVVFERDYGKRPPVVELNAKTGHVEIVPL